MSFHVMSAPQNKGSQWFLIFQEYNADESNTWRSGGDSLKKESM